MEHPHVLKIISRRVDVVDEVESKQSQLCSGNHLMFPCEKTKVLLQMQSLPLSDVMWRIQQSVVKCSCYFDPMLRLFLAVILCCVVMFVLPLLLLNLIDL